MQAGPCWHRSASSPPNPGHRPLGRRVAAPTAAARWPGPTSAPRCGRTRPRADAGIRWRNGAHARMGPGSTAVAPVLTFPRRRPGAGAAPATPIRARRNGRRPPRGGYGPGGLARTRPAMRQPGSRPSRARCRIRGS
ncbi:hypothetical protein G6F22_018980 [Rhizopus arrhizus]|nr:hypothetical protein G6F22_018980 [Rhizopus arrhizus]